MIIMPLTRLHFVRVPVLAVPLRKHGGKCYFIIDETQTLKRAKKMSGVGKLFHHASGKYGLGHTMLKVCLWYRGVIIPWGTWLYLKEPDAKKGKDSLCRA